MSRRDRHGVVRRERRQRLCDRNLVRVEQRLGGGLGQHAAALGEHRAHQLLRAPAVEREADRDRPRRLVQCLEVAGVGDEVHERADGLFGIGVGWRRRPRSGARAPRAPSARPSRRRAAASAGRPSIVRGAPPAQLRRRRLASVIACGVRITSTASTCLSASTALTASPNRCGGASPSTSIGLACDHAGGSAASSAASVAGSSSASAPPRASSASAAITPGPPAFVTIARPSAADRTLACEQLGGGEHVLDSLDAHEPGAAEGGVVDGVLAGHRAGVRDGRLGRRGEPPRLVDDDRLAARKRARRRHELARLGDVLDVEEDRVRLRVLAEIVDQVAEVYVEHVAERDDVREADLLRERPVDDGTSRARPIARRTRRGRRSASPRRSSR